MTGPSSKMPSTNLHVLPPKEIMTVSEVMSHCSNEVAAGQFASVMVIALTGDGQLVIRTSEMDRKTANWLCDMAKLNAQGRL